MNLHSYVKIVRWSWHWQFFSTEFIWTDLLITLHFFIMDDFHKRLCSQDNGTLMLKMHVVTATSSSEMDLSLTTNVRVILNEKDCIIWLVQWELLFIIINGCVCLHQYTGSNNVTGGLYAQICNCLPAGGVVLLLIGRQQL